MPEQPKQIKLIHRWPLGRGYIEPGPILEEQGNQGNYVTMLAPYWGVTAEQAADRTFFEPVEEPREGDPYLFISADGSESKGVWSNSYIHQDRAKIGNVFHPKTRKNQYGVDIDDARKLFLLGLNRDGFAVIIELLRDSQPVHFNSKGWDDARAILAQIEAGEKKL